jgi:large subunit ribosomal protein L29
MATKKKTTAAVRANAFTERRNKAAEKLRNLADNELAHRQSELNDQLFRLKFQLKMGQTESVKKLRELRKDIARAKTILRGRTLGFEPTGTGKK